MHDGVVDQIYGSVLEPERWPEVLQVIGDETGAVGAVFLRQAQSLSWIAAPRVEPHVAAYFAEGWGADTARIEPLFAELYPGFRSEADYRTPQELAMLPTHATYMRERGWKTGLATVVQGAQDDVIQIAIEGFRSFEAAERAKALVDPLRPHLARALWLAGAVEQRRAADIVEALALASLAAAVVTVDGRPVAISAAFERIAGYAVRHDGRLLFRNPTLDAQFTRALAAQKGPAAAKSLLVTKDGDRPVVIHLVPLANARAGLTLRGAIVLIASDGSNARLPGADLLRALFDLTPAEARVCRLVGEGASVTETAARLAVSEATVRVHLRNIFAKTGVRRQSALGALLTGLGSGQLAENPESLP